MTNAPRLVTTLLVSLLLGACSTAYYKAMETIGVEKRDIMVDRVENARNAQAEAKEQFSSALERFSAMVKVDGGELEKTYSQLKSELEASEEQAEAVRDRIAAVEDVSEALFDEWEQELTLYSNASLRETSRRRMQATRRAYEELIRKMHRAESTMTPVLAAFRDQVLFLKHNLNARAIASLEREYATIDRDIRRLVNEMEASIQEADRFIRQLQEP